MKKALHLGLYLCLLTASISAKPLSWERFLNALTTHPEFESYGLATAVSEAEIDVQKRAYAGRLSFTPFFQREEPVGPSAFLPTQSTNIGSELAWRKYLPGSGTQMGVNYRYLYFNQDFPRIALPGTPGSFAIGDEVFHQQVLFLEVAQSLWQNMSGHLSQLPIQTAGLQAQIEKLMQKEAQEAFLLRWGTQFIQSIFYRDQMQLAEKHHALSQAQLRLTQAKMRSGLAETVDLLLVQEALNVSEQNIRQLEFQRDQSLIALRAALHHLPEYQNLGVADLPEHVSLGSVGSGDASTKPRMIQQAQYVIDTLSLQLKGAERGDKPRLELAGQAGLQSGDANFSESAAFDATLLGLTLRFEHPLGKRPGQAEQAKYALGVAKAKKDLENFRRQFDQNERALRAQSRYLEDQMQKSSARVVLNVKKEREEKRLYRNGRRELNFVLQAQQALLEAQQQQQNYAVERQLAQLQHLALHDALLPQ